MKHLKGFNLFEGEAFKATANKDEKKAFEETQKETFRDKVTSHVKSQGCSTEQVGNDYLMGDDLPIYCDGDWVCTVMFRDDEIGIYYRSKPKGGYWNSETDKFEYVLLPNGWVGDVETSLGDIKKALTKIINNWKKDK
jgi:hypothetical protein